MNNAVFLQARMSSTRLPGKVLLPILGEPMLARQVERIKQATLISDVIVCTSSETTDDPIELMCDQYNIRCFRGSLNNVLDRFYQANQAIKADNIIRLTGDCPLTDGDIIDQVIRLHLEEKNDYTSNCHPYTLPDGLDIEIMTQATLAKVWTLAECDDYREHVTLFINKNASLFKRGNFAYSRNYSNERWTVDYPEDFLFVDAVFNALYPISPTFTVEDIIQFLDKHPDVRKLNSKYMTS
ncbi:NTP transferase domain-containing protein [Colwelliaceae bacterium 6471]